MSIYDLNAVPNIVAMGLRDNSGVFSSPMTSAVQTVDRGGFHWFGEYSFTAIRGDERAELLGLIARLRGRQHRLLVPIYDNPKRGAYGGTPLVDGAAQTGNTLNVDGCSLSVTDWIKAGDYFSVDVNGVQELKMATLDASSDGTGSIVLTFEPKLRFAPLNNAAIRVEDGVLAKPAGVFMLANQENMWSSLRIPDGHRSALSLALREDMNASAP